MTFTSIKTAGGWADDAVQAAYALKFHWQLQRKTMFFGLIDHEPMEVPHKGSSITEQRNQFFSEADVANAVTPLDEETDVTPTQLPGTVPVTYTPDERGFSNMRTLKLAKRGLTPVDPVIATAVSDHASRTLDRFAQLQARAGATNKVRAGGYGATSGITATDTATASDIRKVVAKAHAVDAPTRAGEYFLGLAHPYVILDWREETGPGAWRTPVEYGSDQTKIWKGEFGEFEGVRWISTNSVYFADIDADDGAAGSVPVYRSYVLGKEALGKAVVTDPGVVVGPVVDSLRRHRSIGWYSDLDVQVYRPESLWIYESAVSTA